MFLLKHKMCFELGLKYHVQILCVI